MIDKNKPGPKTFGYTVANEMDYLQHAVRDDGKKSDWGQNITDGVKILETWLNTYKKRKWDFVFSFELVDIAKRNLETLKKKRANEAKNG